MALAIVPYLREMGMDPGLRWRVEQWLQQRTGQSRLR
jgi:hypothetical protein